jgi:hypothetical protein
MLVQLRAYAKSHYVRGIKGEGNRETYHLFMTPSGVAALKQDSDFLNNVRWMSAGKGDSSQLATGAVADVDGLMIHEFRHVPNTSGASTKFGSGGTVEGQYALLCGAQALAMADIGNAKWTEKGFDYENQQGIAVAKIAGFLKPQFYSIYDGSIQDHGGLVCYTAV